MLFYGTIYSIPFTEIVSFVDTFSKMFRLVGRRLTRSPYAKAVPLVPLISSGSSSAVQSAGDAGVEDEPPDPDH